MKTLVSNTKEYLKDKIPLVYGKPIVLFEFCTDMEHSIADLAVRSFVKEFVESLDPLQTTEPVVLKSSSLLVFECLRTYLAKGELSNVLIKNQNSDLVLDVVFSNGRMDGNFLSESIENQKNLSLREEIPYKLL